MSGALKKTTAIAGLDVVRNPHQLLNAVHTKILRVLEKMPQDAAYRKHTENIINQRQLAIKAEPNIAALEVKINGGQVEELLQQARKELKLSRNMLNWKPWEQLHTEAPHNQWKWPMQGV